MIRLLAHNWRLVFLRGVVAILLGSVALTWPTITVGELVLLFGSYLLLDGVFTIGVALNAPPDVHRVMTLLMEGLILAFRLRRLTTHVPLAS
ncbi:MAG TPA: DUF308 domain-containing protein [Bryobacteraceae bacterium]|jgi:uncharacterized membrane protein HdeD (DUF308 family)